MSINIHGKEYVTVNERVQQFHREFKGSITTELITDPEAEMVVFKATVALQDGRIFTGYSQASWSDTKSMVNSTSAMENAETSAVGRALGFLGIGIVDSIATADEVGKAQSTTPYTEKYATEKQIALIERLVSQKMLPDQWLEKKGLDSFEKIKFADVNKYLAELQ